MMSDMTWIETFNQTLFLRVNATGEAPAWLFKLAVFFADELIYVIPALLIIMWLRGGSTRRGLAIKSCLITLLALGLNQGIGLIWQHPRPAMINLGHTWIASAADSSFPSDHMTVFTAVGLTLLLGRATRSGAAILASGILVAWARVYLGVHFPLDMVGAVIVVAATYLVVAALWSAYGEGLTKSAERLFRILFAGLIASGWIRN